MAKEILVDRNKEIGSEFFTGTLQEIYERITRLVDELGDGIVFSVEPESDYSAGQTSTLRQPSKTPLIPAYLSRMKLLSPSY